MSTLSQPEELEIMPGPSSRCTQCRTLPVANSTYGHAHEVLVFIVICKTKWGIM
jgi:hypothetical protein